MVFPEQLLVRFVFTTLVLALLTFSICKDVSAQSYYTPNLFTKDYSGINPAVIGGADQFDITLYAYHYPSEYYNYSVPSATFTVPLKKVNSAIGARFSYENVGVYTDYSTSLLYVYRSFINENLSISFGFDFSMHYEKRELSQLFFLEDDPGWKDETEYWPDLNVGALVDFYGFRVGAVIRHINRPQLESHGEVYTVNRVYALSLGKDVNLGERCTLENELLYLGNSSHRDIYLNNLFAFQNGFIVGWSLWTARSIDFGPVLGVNLSDRFQFYVTSSIISNTLYKNSGRSVECVFKHNF